MNIQHGLACLQNEGSNEQEGHTYLQPRKGQTLAILGGGPIAGAVKGEGFGNERRVTEFPLPTAEQS